MSAPSKTQSAGESLTTSWLGRSFKLSAAGAKMVGCLLGSPNRRSTAGELASNTDMNELTREGLAGRELARSLGAMKGLAMKAGQLLSYTGAALPAAAQQALVELQDAAPPMSPEVAERVISESLGAPPSRLFAVWEPHAFAAASIGQVHRATLHDGTRVAVKVQYPGIAEAIRADLASVMILKTLAGLSGLSGPSTGSFIDELRQRLLDECDYHKERANQDKFAALWQHDTGIRVARTFSKFSSERVLTSELVEGCSFRDFVEVATQEQKDRAGESIFRFAFESIFRHQRFNCDPHPGNYLFPAAQVAFLDFGCVQQFEAHRIEAWKRLIRSVLSEDRGEFRRALHELDLIGNERKFDFEQQFRISRYLYEPWLRDAKFAYSAEYVDASFKIMVSENGNFRNLRIPRDFVFVNRLQWGLNSVLAKLGANVNWHRLLLPLVLGDASEAKPSVPSQKVKSYAAL